MYYNNLKQDIRNKGFFIYNFSCKIFRFAFYKKAWFTFFILFFLISYFFIAPSLTEKINLGIYKDGKYLLIRRPIEESLLRVYSIPNIYDRYDLVFENIAEKECDTDFLLSAKKDTIFYNKALEVFKKDVVQKENDKYAFFKFDEGEKKVIKNYSIYDDIYFTAGMSMQG